MRRFVEGTDRGQSTLFPECLEDWIDEDNPVRVIDVFVDNLDLAELTFDGVEPEATGRPSYHPAVLLKLYIYGYLNRVQSSRRLEREAGRNVEVMWLAGRLVPDHKTIADFRKDNGPAIRKVCARFVELCREMGLIAKASVAIDGSKFKAVNNRDKNFTRAKVERRRAQLEESAGDPRVSRGRHHGDATETDDVRCEIGRPFWQAGLRLHRRPGCLSVSGRRAADLSLHERGGRQGSAALLDDGMSGVLAHEGAAGQLVLHRGVRARDAGPRVDNRAISRDRRGQGLGAVKTGTSLGQKLDTAAIGDAMLALNSVPKLATVLAKLARG
jgi:transposase